MKTICRSIEKDWRKSHKNFTKHQSIIKTKKLKTESITRCLTILYREGERERLTVFVILLSAKQHLIINSNMNTTSAVYYHRKPQLNYGLLVLINSPFFFSSLWQLVLMHWYYWYWWYWCLCGCHYCCYC